MRAIRGHTAVAGGHDVLGREHPVDARSRRRSKRSVGVALRNGAVDLLARLALGSELRFPQIHGQPQGPNSKPSDPPRSRGSRTADGLGVRSRQHPTERGCLRSNGAWVCEEGQASGALRRAKNASSCRQRTQPPLVDAAGCSHQLHAWSSRGCDGTTTTNRRWMASHRLLTPDARRLRRTTPWMRGLRLSVRLPGSVLPSIGPGRHPRPLAKRVAERSFGRISRRL